MVAHFHPCLLFANNGGNLTSEQYVKHHGTYHNDTLHHDIPHNNTPHWLTCDAQYK